jgi:hypothetical protein
MNPPAHSLHPVPSRRDPAKKLRRNVRHPVNFAVPAAQQVLERILGQMLHRYLASPRRNRIGFARVVD